MVLIEHEESKQRNANPSNAANDDSDGFETASDTDLAGEGDDSGAGIPEEQNRTEQSHTEKQTEQEPEHDAPRSSESSENNALISEEESRQVRF